MDTITLIKRGGMWNAEFSGPHSEQVQALFGTKVIPTPFMDTTSGYMVFNSVQAKNPGVQIQMEDAL